jgi:hypothetical protein
MSLELQKARVLQAGEEVKNLEYEFEAAYANFQVPYITVWSLHTQLESARTLLELASERLARMQLAKDGDPYPERNVSPLRITRR